MKDVAILGYGPVGALLANLLGQAGLSVAVYERETEVFPLPRAVHFDGEVMRIFQSTGLADHIALAARPSSQGMHFVNASDQTLLVRRGIEGPGPHGWPNNWYFHQPFLEQVLREGVGRFPHVEVHLGSEITDVNELDARCIVGCDGARSSVRRAIGSRQRDLGLHQPWLVVDLLCDPSSPRVKTLPDYTVQFCDPARPMTIVNVGGARRRWEIMLMPGDDPGRLTEPDVFWPMLRRWLDPRDARIERAAIYTFHSLVQEGWRKGNLLLAGDACHQTPPFLGQGMCAGMRDAANLAWKLMAVLRDGAPDSLLDTYESERRPHVETFIALAVKLGAVLQETDPAKAAERDRRFANGAEMFDFPQPQLGPGCRAEAPPPVGTIFPQPRLADGRLMDEAIGSRFAVVGEIELLADRRPDAVTLPGVGANWLAQRGLRAALLRPDRYIAEVA
ncbi:MAG: bifunctional 3-(3-hydroxy-phenyl)propionate/3-hydroxycinnamic acid hydroxylase [Bradyrhizobium sp.]|uniref:bifunctional 3-(3-hydroxy-phenyl)propionate/3-hydroxycinnamic acid hydroxylase MhpA n=1 Tax=Bradyrhizobium sp. TaxID=376 RepID=UPI001D6E4BDE|nr:bifunctional 3-(3-hydroxy-phenyl)propionate/3-hydroxycinnamic acid hydroxylase [Bradyrhizobium sp.]MBV9564107.1 bifunctional 3-(3-hydroxy-phenyl)propionate/3-hydroxycinnamic acid hydroxylase [Bradyrhizobium sp.]